MKTFTVKISEKHHKIGSIVVMAENEDSAINQCCYEMNVEPECFEKPVEVKSGIVHMPTRSAWDGYH